MSNRDVVNAFIDTLLEAPDLTMQAVKLRLAHSDFELKLLKADILKPFEKEWAEAHIYQFPFMTEGGVS